MKKYLTHTVLFKSFIFMMTLHLLNVSVNVNDRMLSHEENNEIESIFELVSVHVFGESGALPDNPFGEDEDQNIVNSVAITWFINQEENITPQVPIHLDELPTNSKLLIARPLFYTSPSFPTDTPPPKVA